QGFTDAAFTPWPKRNPDMREGAAILIKSGNLRDSLQVLERTPSRLTFGSNVPYSEIHNQGGTLSIPVTDKARRFFWYQYKRTGAEHWKWMALTKKERFTIHMPKRQFIGHSQTLMTALNAWAVKHIEGEFKKHVNP
ncbi:MAG: phage virion morphogenesis protein, partial [Flavobacteriales bacterium]